jgi:hypothetical protein
LPSTLPPTIADIIGKITPTKLPNADEKVMAERALELLSNNGFSEISEWCVFKLKERKLDGAKNYSAYHLRLDARAQFPDKREAVDQLIDLHFMEMNTVAEYTAKYGDPKNLGG